MREIDRPILVVDDDDIYFEGVLRAFGKAGITCPLRRCEDGDRALDYLHRRGSFSNPADSPRPSIMLLDLNMPGMDGFEVLDRVKAEQGLREIPVVIVSTSSAPESVQRSYRGGAASYIVKPMRFGDFQKVVTRLKDYWLETVELPN